MAFPEVVVTAAAPVAGQPENTPTNLDANVVAEPTPPTDASAGAAPDATTTAPSEPEAAPAAPVEGTPEAEAAAKSQRISQDNANLRALALKMGIEPDSDTAEQLVAGLVTYEDIQRARQPATTTEAQPSTPTAPEIPLGQKIDNLRSVLSKPIPPEGLSADEVVSRQNALLDVVAGQAKQIENVTKSQEQKDQQDEAGRMVAATNDVFEKEVLSGLGIEIPEEVRQIAASAFLGATDIENINLGNTVGVERANTPDGYRHSATQIAPQFKQLIQALVQVGRNPNPNPNPNPRPTVPTPVPGTRINPLRPGGGPTPAPPVDKDYFDIRNLDRNVAIEQARQEGQV